MFGNVVIVSWYNNDGRKKTKITETGKKKTTMTMTTTTTTATTATTATTTTTTTATTMLISKGSKLANHGNMAK